MNFRDEIPQRAFINAQIIQQAEENGSWSESILNITKQYHLTNYQVVNPAHIVSLMYCLFVVPKELWIKRNKFHSIFSEINTNIINSIIDNISYSNPKFSDDFAYNFLNKLRNSIAHANYSFDENMNFEFWDTYNGTENFRCTMNIKNLSRLISMVGSTLANLRNKT
jgi:hypothetical protein